MNMKEFFEFIVNNWIYLATIFGLYYGIRYYWHDTRTNKAIYIFNNEQYLQDPIKNIKLKVDYEKPWKYSNGVIFYYHFVHGGLQLIFNFMGGFFGWICLYIFARKNLNIFENDAILSLDWSDLFLFVFAFLGLGGFLPQAIHSTTRALDSLVSLLVNWLNKEK